MSEVEEKILPRAEGMSQVDQTQGSELEEFSIFGLLKISFTKGFEAITSLSSGMKLTLGYLLSPKTVVTQQYPENRDTLKMKTRFRGSVTMPHDVDGEHKCTGCTLCEKACPNATISILHTKSLSGKKILGKFIYRYDQCTLCNLCIESCPFDAIVMGHEFEAAADNRESFKLTLNKKEGRT